MCCSGLLSSPTTDVLTGCFIYEKRKLRLREQHATAYAGPRIHHDRGLVRIESASFQEAIYALGARKMEGEQDSRLLN